MEDLTVLSPHDTSGQSFGELIYRTSLLGVKKGTATWNGNTVTWNNYETFADTISFLQEWRLPSGKHVFSIQRSFVLGDEDIVALRKSVNMKYTSFMLRNNFWHRYNLNTKAKNPNGTFEFLKSTGDPFGPGEWMAFVKKNFSNEINVLNQLPFQYTLNNLVRGGPDEMNIFVETLEPKPIDEYVFEDQSRTTQLELELKDAKEEIARLNQIVKEHEAHEAAASVDPSDKRLEKIELSIIQLTQHIANLP